MVLRSSGVAVAAVLAVTAVLALSACGSSGGPSESNASASKDDAPKSNVKMALVLPETPHDFGWNLAMQTAAQAVAQQEHVSLSIADNAFDPSSSEPIIRRLLTGGYKVIIAHGFNFQDVITGLAPGYPDQIFTIASFAKPRGNVGVYTYSYLETGYSMCWLGAKLSKKHVIGMVGAGPVPYNIEEDRGCKLGAQAAVPGTKTIELFANDFFDQQKAREQAQNAVSQGADVLFSGGGVDSSVGVLRFCEDQKLICMGINYDQSKVGPHSVVSSAMIDWKPYIRGMIEDAQNGTYEAAIYDASFENGGLSVPAFNGPSAERVPSDVQAGFQKVIADLRAGRIKFPASTAHPGYP